MNLSPDFIYNNFKNFQRNPIQLFSVQDEYGASVDRAVNQAYWFWKDNDLMHWDRLLSQVKWFRWHLAHTPTLPGKYQFNSPLRPRLIDIVDELKKSKEFGVGVSELDSLVNVIENFDSYEAVFAKILIETLQDFEGVNVQVIAADSASAEIINEWLPPVTGREATILSAFRAMGESPEVIVAVGAPRSFSSSIFSSPLAPELIYIFPRWFQGKNLPISELGSFLDNFKLPPTRLFDETVEDSDYSLGKEETWTAALDEVVDDESLIINHKIEGEEKTPARLIRMTGGFYSWMGSNDECRILTNVNPFELKQEPVVRLQSGQMIVVKKSGAESGELREQAVKHLGDYAFRVENSQLEWKNRLEAAIKQLGLQRIEKEFDDLGIEVASGALRWIDPLLMRPRHDDDFKKLLNWLGLEPSEYVDNADILRSAHQWAVQRLQQSITDGLHDLNEERLKQLWKYGYQNIVLDAGAASEFLISTIVNVSSKDRMVSLSSIGTVQSEKDLLWQS